MNNLLDAALAYAAKGWPIFPCRADKTPLTKNAGADATTNPQTIEGWWSQWPRANIGLDCASAGFMVLDFDPGHDPVFRDSLPKTALASRTPRGGYHRFYAIAPGEIVSPSASKISPHVDVRSFHSYVLLPPSRTDAGAYEWESEGQPAYRTDEMVRLANVAREKHKDRDEWLIEPDLPENVENATKWLINDARIAIEGQGGDATAYATAAHLKSFGISQALAFDLMYDHWSPRCQPPWGADEVEHLEAKIENGYRYNTSPPGNITAAYRVAKSQTLFKPVQKPLASGHEFTAGRFRVVDHEGMAHIKPPSWLIRDFLPAGAYALMFGAPGTFKTFLALDAALSVCTGGFSPEGLWHGQVEKAGNVLFAVGEGRSQFTARVDAWSSKHYGGARIDGFYLADPVPNVAEDIDPFVNAALAASPRGFSLVVIDTIGRSMQGLNENSQEHASKFTALVERLHAEFGGATILALHHTGHDKTTRERGSTVFRADTDTSIRVDREPGEAQVSLSMVKQKDAAEWTSEKWCQLEPIGGSLVATRFKGFAAAGEAPPAPSLEGKQQKKRKGGAQEKYALAVYEAIALDKLRDNPTAIIEPGLMYKLIKADKRIDGGSISTIRKKIGILTGMNASPLKAAYTPRTGFCGRNLV